jgi:hypothetical protein
MNKPSQQTLERAFPGKGKVLRRLLTSDHDAAIKRERECFNSPSLADLRMHALNAELETFGVEYIKGKGRSRSIEYLNTGDTYATTIIRFSDGQYRVSSWGDIVERGNYE